MNLTKIITVLLLTISSLSYGQQPPITAEDLLQRSKEFFEDNPSFKVDLEYTLYRNKQSPVVIEAYKGKLLKKGADLYLKIHNTEILIVKGGYLKVNHDQKLIEYSKTSAYGVSQDPLDISQYLNLFQNKEVISNNGLWECKLTTPKLTQLPYGAIQLFFNKDTYFIEKQTLELVAPGSIKDEEGALNGTRKYLDIAIENFDVAAKTDGFFNFQKFILVNSTQLKTTPQFDSYKIIDRTVKK